MRSSPYQAGATVEGVLDHGREHRLNLTADYGWVAAWSASYKEQTLALLREPGSRSIHYFMAFDPRYGIPEDFKDYEVIWRSDAEKGVR